MSLGIDYYDFGVGPMIVFMAGTHGNEPAGSVALARLLSYFERMAAVWPIMIRIIPRVNEWGLDNDKREDADGRDVNRGYTEENVVSLSNVVKRLIAPAILVVDFHEGWSWHISTPESIGSTVSPGPSTGELVLANRMTAALNATITDPTKKFMMLADIYCDIPSAISCWCRGRGQSYVLIETTGQKNIQPICVRVAQVIVCVQETMSFIIDGGKMSGLAIIKQYN